MKAKKVLTCVNCGAEIDEEQKRHNKGYCNECAFEAVGEGEV